MPRRRTHASATRNRLVCIRLTDDDYNARRRDAERIGLTLSGLCERLVLNRKVELENRARYRAMDPSLLAELRRIGNNINQIAHASNAGLPVDAQLAARNLGHQLFDLLAQELIAQRDEMLRVNEKTDDPKTPPARDVFHRSVQVHPARSKDDFP